jgi:hypothetical protein
MINRWRGMIISQYQYTTSASHKNAGNIKKDSSTGAGELSYMFLTGL